jgi:hypothetical protein
MRSFYTAVLFVVGGVLLLSAAYLVSEWVDPVYPEMKAKVALLRERRLEVEAVTVGNSHNRAIDFEALGVPGVHMWNPGQDIFEAGFLARYSTGEAVRLRYVLLPISFGIQRIDHAVVANRDNTGRRRELYARVPLLRPIQGDFKLWISGAIAPVARGDHWLGVVARVNRPRRSVRLTADGTRVYLVADPLSTESLIQNAFARSSAHRAAADATVAADPSTPRRVVAELNETARRLRDRNIKLILYTPPYHETYRLATGPAAISETKAVIETVLNHNPDLFWLDFSATPEFDGRDELFHDSDHLNPDGARVFSILLRSCLDLVAAADSSPPPTLPDCPVVRPR